MKSETNFFNIRNFQFLAIFLAFLGCLFLSDESRKPLIYNGKELSSKQNENIITFYTPKFLFNKGSYNINIDFGDTSANISKVELWRQSEKLNEWEISSDMSTFSNNFSLPYDSQDVQFRIVVDNNQQSTINNQQSTINNQQL